MPAGPAEVKAFASELVRRADDGWRTTILHLDNWEEPVELRHRDGLEFIKQLFSDPALQDCLVLQAAKAFRTTGNRTQRVFDKPWQGNGWIDEQEAVQAQHGIDAIIAALQVGVPWRSAVV